MAASAASTASTVSKAPILRADAGRDGAGAEGALAGAGAAGRATEVPGRAEVPVELGDGGTGGARRPACGAGAVVAVARAAVGAAVAGAAAGATPVGGRDGSLIVGAEVGLGGSAMRTVSFFGCTFAASAGFGGTGESGVGSDIKFIVPGK